MAEMHTFLTTILRVLSSEVQLFWMKATYLFTGLVPDVGHFLEKTRELGLQNDSKNNLKSRKHEKSINGKFSS